jgi:hypothetical protein
MINDLLSSLRKYARERNEEVRRGGCSATFAISLFQCYSDSMITALRIIGRDTDIRAIKSETTHLCASMYKRNDIA